MARDVLMPVITASGEEAVVTAWFVDEGETCAAGQLLAEVQAEKVSAEVEAPGAGFVVDRVAINDPVGQGDVICRITEEAKTVEPPAGAPAAGRATTARVPSSPSARRVARELGVDLQTVKGTGPAGRITEADVKAAIDETSPKGSGLRSVIARNMRRSHAETAPVTLHSTVDLGADAPTQITATVVKTVAQTLLLHPHLNGHREGDVFSPAEEARISLAIQTEAGLLAPVVPNLTGGSVDEIADSIRQLAQRAQASQLTAADFEGGTFSVTNLGAYGVDGFTPIINLPQVAILGVGAVRRVPAVDEAGNVSSRHQIVLSLTFDHAFIDGGPAAAFLQDVGEALAARSD